MASWGEIIAAASRKTADALGETVTVASADAVESVDLQGIYDRRPLAVEVNGTRTIEADYRVSVPTADVPAWVDAHMRGQGATITTAQGDSLWVTDIHRDGQGMTVFFCRAASS